MTVFTITARSLSSQPPIPDQVIREELDRRPEDRARIINAALLQPTARKAKTEEDWESFAQYRKELRDLHAMQQERYLAMHSMKNTLET